MNVLSELQKVEKSWLIPLYATCQHVFSQTHLPSHNEDHHHRVWILAKELIKQLEKQAITFTRSDLTKIIIAAFLHDTGMSVTIDKTHGKESRKICKKFIEEYNPEDIDNLQELLDVIENHDDKEYQNKFAKIKNPKHLFKILSVCDDLDAFGLTGVYRYIEIYLLRGIPVKDIGSMVLKNLTGRINYFTGSFRYLEKYHKKHIKRFDLTWAFFTDLNNQIIQKKKTNSLNGPVGVINLINHHVIVEKMTPVEASEFIIRNTTDDYVKNYFTIIKFDTECTKTNLSLLLQFYGFLLSN